MCGITGPAHSPARPPRPARSDHGGGLKASAARRRRSRATAPGRLGPAGRGAPGADGRAKASAGWGVGLSDSDMRSGPVKACEISEAEIKSASVSDPCARSNGAGRRRRHLGESATARYALPEGQNAAPRPDVGRLRRSAWTCGGASRVRRDRSATSRTAETHRKARETARGSCDPARLEVERRPDCPLRNTGRHGFEDTMQRHHVRHLARSKRSDVDAMRQEFGAVSVERPA